MINKYINNFIIFIYLFEDLKQPLWNAEIKAGHHRIRVKLKLQ